MSGPVPTLAIGNKCYSSWSMRPWLVLKQFGIPFNEVLVPLKQPESAARLAQFSPTGKVPAFQLGDVRVWESTAIIETIADLYPQHAVWPRDRRAKAHARSIVAEMHAGFAALRNACSMNLGKRFATKDRGADVAADVARLTQMWRDCRTRFGKGGPFLFGAFSAADAMYAPVVSRFETYGIPVDADIRAYMDAVQALPSYQEWVEAALDEPWVLAGSENDETPTKVLRRNAEARAKLGLPATTVAA